MNLNDEHAAGDVDAATRRPFAFSARLGLGLVLLIVGNALIALGGASVAGLVLVGVLVLLVGLVLTVGAVVRGAEAIEAIAAALKVTRPAPRDAQHRDGDLIDPR